MNKITIKKSMLKNKRDTIIAKGKINGKMVVAVTGSIGDWAGYIEPENINGKWTPKMVAEKGYKIYIAEIDKYFKMEKGVKENYRA